MSNIKVVPGRYVNQDALECLIAGYIFPKAFIIGGLAVDPQIAVEQMKLVKDAWNKRGGKQLHHFILNFSPWESSKITNHKKLEQLAYKVCEHFADEYQIVFGIHDNGHIHIHFVMNSVSYLTGGKFIHRNSDDFVLADCIRDFYIPETLGHPFPISKIPVYYYY